MNKIILREYQQTVYNRCKEAYRQYKHIAVWSPTGSGKSIIFMYMIQRAVFKKKSVLVLVTRDTLQDQVKKYCEQFGIEYGIIHHTKERNNNKVQIGIVDSVISRLDELQYFDTCIVDEMHLSAASDFMTCLNYLKEKGTSIIGFSATIRRLDGIGLGESAGGAFQTIVRGPELKWLVDQGYLVDTHIYAPQPPELISVSGDDFNISEYMRNTGGSKRLSNAVQLWEQHAKHKLTVAFTCNIKDARNVRDEFRAAGYKAETLHSKKKEKQIQILKDFHDRKIEILVTVDLLSYGVDIPIIECALCMRPTASETLYLQQLGRVLRPVYTKGDTSTKESRLMRIRESSKPVAIILDLASNVYIHGFPTEERQWTLEGRKNSQSLTERITAACICLSCGRSYDSSDQSCPYCGAGKNQRKRAIKQATGELILVTEQEYQEEMKKRQEEHERKAQEEKQKEERKAEYNRRRKLAKTFEEYQQIETDLGLKKGWAYVNYQQYLRARKKYFKK